MSARCSAGLEQSAIACRCTPAPSARTPRSAARRNRRQRRVEVLDHVVDPAPEVAGEDAEPIANGSVASVASVPMTSAGAHRSSAPGRARRCRSGPCRRRDTRASRATTQPAKSSSAVADHNIARHGTSVFRCADAASHTPRPVRARARSAASEEPSEDRADRAAGEAGRRAQHDVAPPFGIGVLQVGTAELQARDSRAPSCRRR